MKKIKLIITLCFLVFLAACSSDDDSSTKVDNTKQEIILPKDLRAVWFTTVWQRDWPQNQFDVSVQKKMYTDYLDKMVEFNFNSIFVQVRSMADAFYKSKYEPWSANITGVRGQDPGYDVMRFMVEEAHKRGLEFHAWINPYRISTRAKVADSFAPLKMELEENMYVDCQKIRVYNPALPEVRQRLADIVLEIINNYDVDGIVMDDYFYPSLEPGEEFPDAKDYSELAEVGQTKDQFRFSNVDKTIKLLHESIVAARPEVSFTVSPQGNADNNKKIYADVESWTKEKWVDFVMPQLYYDEPNFSKWANHWSRYSWYSVPMIAYGLYKVEDGSFNVAQIQRQFEVADRYPRYMGTTFYSAKALFSGNGEVDDLIKSRFANPALIPHNGRKVLPEPTAPVGVSLSGSVLSWDSNNSDVIFAVYRVAPSFYDSDKARAELVVLTKEKTTEVNSSGRYYITAVNKRNHESNLSLYVEKK